MAIAITLQEFLENSNIHYDLVEHPYSRTAREAALAAHVPGEKVAKCVVLEDEQGIVVAVAPADRQIDLQVLERYLGRRLHLLSQRQLTERFFDCEVGAVPPVGMAYGFDTILDDSLLQLDEIFFEAGDHTDLVHLRGEDFQQLMQDAEVLHLSRQPRL